MPTLDSLPDRITSWCADFERSKQYNLLEEGEQLLSEDIISFFSEFMDANQRPLPNQWQPDGVEEILLYQFPAHIAADERYFIAVRPVLCQFVDYLLEDKSIQLQNNLTIKMRIVDSDPQMQRNAFDRACWGLAKTWAMQAWEAGVDLTNDEAVGEYFAQLNPEAADSEHWMDSHVVSVR